MENGVRWRIPLLAALLLVAGTANLSAQIRFNGALDLEAAAGGPDIRFVTSELPLSRQAPHLSIYELNLVAFAPVDEWFSVETQLRVDSWGDGALHAPQVGIAVFNWTPDGRGFTLSAGRFTTPVGNKSELLFPVQRKFITKPLAYGYFLNLSDTKGYWAAAGDGGSWGSGDIGVTALGYEGLSSGFRWDWASDSGRWEQTLAVTNAAPSTNHDRPNMKSYALLGRSVYNMGEYSSIGLSWAWGSWMSQEDLLPDKLTNTTKYRQLLFGTELCLRFGQLELSGEGFFSQWNAPLYGDTAFVVTGVGGTTPFTVRPRLLTGYLDAIWHFKTQHGAWLGLRGDLLRPMKMALPQSGGEPVWDRMVTRWAMSSGIGLTPNIRWAFTYTNQVTNADPVQVHDWTVRSWLSVLF